MIPKKDLKNNIVSAGSTIAEAAYLLNDAKIKFLVCLTKNDELIGTITDGDLRRSIVSGISSSDQINNVMNFRPIVAGELTSSSNAYDMLKLNKISHLPIIDKDRRFIGLCVDKMEHEYPISHNHTMVIMAGGLGTRLKPLTDNCPKPMIELNGKPMLLHIIERAKAVGFSKFIISVNYLSHVITDYFANGSKFGVQIEYIHEEKKLGTAGALSLLIDKPSEHFIVTNGDVLTDLDYLELLEFASSKNATAVMAVKRHEIKNPFGVVELDGLNIQGFTEKPSYISYINAGTYVLSPESLNILVKNEALDMPDLFEALRNSKYKVMAYPMHEKWLDVGRHHDLEQAREISKEQK